MLHYTESRPTSVRAMKEASRSTHSTALCRSYVGEGTPAAAEYHCDDFDWEELRQEAEAMLAKRHAQLQVIYLQACRLHAEHLLQTTPPCASFYMHLKGVDIAKRSNFILLSAELTICTVRDSICAMLLPQ